MCAWRTIIIPWWHAATSSLTCNLFNFHATNWLKPSPFLLLHQKYFKHFSFFFFFFFLLEDTHPSLRSMRESYKRETIRKLPVKRKCGYIVFTKKYLIWKIKRSCNFDILRPILFSKVYILLSPASRNKYT